MKKIKALYLLLHCHSSKYKLVFMQEIPPLILVVDDDPDIGTLLKTMLEFKGYKAVVVQTAVELESAINNHKDTSLVILDMLLSGANGIDICTALKQQHHTAHIPVLMMSAHPQAKELASKAGANDFIAKPFDIYDILNKVQYLTTGY